jgi:hypothetical protein
MKRVSQSITLTGTAGSASGTAAFDSWHDGKLYAVYLDYGSTVAATTDVSIKAGTPAVTMFERLNSATDGWFFPRYRPVTNTAAQFAQEADDAAQMLPIVGAPQLVVAQSTPVANAVTAYLFIEED